MSNTRTWSELKAAKMTPEQIAKSEDWAREESARLDLLERKQFDDQQALHLRKIEQPPATQTTREKFIAAIKQRRHIGVGYVTASGATRYIMAAPLDFGPSRKAVDKSDRYHMWDVARQHVVSIKPEQLRVLDTPIELHTFDPEKLVTWCTKKSPWFIPRDWGSKS